MITAILPLEILHGLQQIIIQGKHTASVSERCLPGLCQLQRPAVLAKERCSQLVLKTLHLQADGRGCPSKTIRRLRETTDIMRRDESPQSVEIEITQKHPALSLHELRRRSRINAWRGFGEV